MSYQLRAEGRRGPGNLSPVIDTALDCSEKMGRKRMKAKDKGEGDERVGWVGVLCLLVNLLVLDNKTETYDGVETLSVVQQESF